MKAGIFQCASGGLIPDERLKLLDEICAGQGLDIILCPELFMSGYNIGDKLPKLAESADGPFAKKIADLARKHGTAILYGYPERDGDTLYNSAQCIDNSGVSISNHRKLLLPPGFEADYFTAGNSLTFFDFKGFRCSILICYDAEFPETFRAASMQGAEVIFVPTALGEAWGSVAQKMMPTRAFENGVWMLYANHSGHEENVNYLGNSCIATPDSKDIAQAGAGTELITAIIDAERVKKAQNRLPYHQDRKKLMQILSDNCAE